jgi:hypothetical protein
MISGKQIRILFPNEEHRVQRIHYATAVTHDKTKPSTEGSEAFEAQRAG